MIYIWYGNFQTFKQAESYKQSSIGNTYNKISNSKDRTIQYQKPKLNPFKRYSISQPQSKPKTQRRQPQKTAQKLSTQYQLQGIISEKNRSQAIIISSDSNSSIISIHEKFRDWELIKIDKNYIIFKNDKLYDTLRLQTIK